MTSASNCLAVDEIGDRFDTLDVGRKVRSVPLFRGSRVAMKHNVAWAEA